MKRILVIIKVVLIHSLQGQITMETNLPSVLPINSETTFEVKIKKGNLTNFSKYQMEVPEGIVIKENDNKTGSFSFEENKAKVIWVITPADPEFSISMKLVAGNTPGAKPFGIRYFYMENEDKKEIEMMPITVVFKDSAAGTTPVIEGPFTTLIPKNAALSTTINPTEINTKNPAVLIQQVMQLRKDSKDAFKVGATEKAKAEAKLKDANSEIAKAEQIKNEDDRKIALDKANLEKQKAENDLAVAERVIVLAKSLEDNANQIETINRSLNPGAFNPTANVTSNHVANTASTNAVAAGEHKNGQTKDNSSNKDIDKLKESFKASGNEPDGNESSAPESGLVYKVQVGAFGKEPLTSDFKGIGKVTVRTEGGMYKVLVGSFTSKEDALKKREQVIGKGFDGFVVSYKDGIRVK
jgi:cell division protein FtsN